MEYLTNLNAGFQVGLILILCGLSTLVLIRLYTIYFEVRWKPPYMYRSSLTISILKYVIEIIIMFGLFLLIFTNPLHEFQYILSEKSYFKMFIDFFTIYQILVFVIFKLIDSHYITAYQNILRVLQMFRHIIDSDEDIENILTKHMATPQFGFRLPEEARYFYSEIFKQMEHYNELYKSGNKEHLEAYRITLNKVHAYYDMLLNQFIGQKQDEWGVSLLNRIHKAGILNKVRMAQKNQTQINNETQTKNEEKS